MKPGKTIILSVYILMAIVFLPVLFCVFFVGNRMDYNPFLKIEVLLPAYLLFFTAALVLGAVCFLFWKTGRWKLTDRKSNGIANAVLAVLFAALYVLNVQILREIGFKLPWDIGIVREVAYSFARGEDLGYFYNLSVYTNNIPIAYILGRLYSFGESVGNYPYAVDFIWLQTGCALVSVGGYFCCLTVKKLTRRIMPVAVSFFLYLALTGMSPWKMAPYTDVYGMIFPIISIYCYLCYREARKTGYRYLFISLSLISGMAGGLVKPSIYIVVIAVLGVELLCFFMDYRENWKYMGAEILLAVLLFAGREACMDHMIDEMGMIFNEEIEAGWQHYLAMGANEDSTGSYDSDDAGIFGEYQTSKSQRNKVALERAAQRIGERGILGNLRFWLKKMVMVFNDGTFGWGCEIWIDNYYPGELSRGNAMTGFLRDIYWPHMAYTGRYHTFCQLAWFFCLTGIPGLCLCRREKRKDRVILAVSFLGIFFYQMLFEAQARYLFVFLPLLIAISVYGMVQYTCRMAECPGWRRGKTAWESGEKPSEDILGIKGKSPK